MNKIDNVLNRIIDEACNETCHEYCFLKKLVQSLHPAADLVIQLKCVELFKWDLNKTNDVEMEWNDAFAIWVEKGYASTFRAVYDVNLPIKEIYDLTINYPQNQIAP